MNYLLDTHIVLWLAREPNKLSKQIIEILENLDNQIYFSSINLWEIALKNSLGKSGFQYDVVKLKILLLENGFLELPVTSNHAPAIATLPFIHKDPFDRMLIAQAMTENICLITDDDKILQYPNLTLLAN